MVSFTKNKDYYKGINQKVYDMVPVGAKKLLDVGCGTGEFGKKLKDEKGLEQVFGVEVSPEIASEASEKLDRVFRSDIESTRLDGMRKYFDCIVMSGILHHLRDPWSVLRRMKEYLKDDGCLIAAIPNVAHISMIKELLKGKWCYSDQGILDVCHMKFFTLDEMTKMFSETGYQIEAIDEDIADLTRENMDFIKRLSAAVEVGANFERDSFVFQFVTKWTKQ